MMHKTGPKISSLAMVISLETFANTVGLTKYPWFNPSGFPGPPTTTSAPSSIPFSMRPWILLNWTSLTTGPILVDSSEGSPTTIPSATAFAASLASSCLVAGTSILEGALHDCPVLLNMCAVPFVTALLKSASSKMIFADFPPNSWWTLLTVSAEPLATATPALVEPVKDIISILGWADIASPTEGPSPFTKLNTPFGTPASWRTSANRIALKGAISVGFRTIVQPAARAGPTLQEIWFIGQFQGVIIPTTPIGSFLMSAEPLTSSNL